MENFSFQYSSWFLIVCFLLAILYAGFLYTRTKQFEGKARWTKPLLGFLRALTVGILGFLLLGPLFKTIKEDVKKPKIAILIDKSESVGQWLKKANDSDFKNQIDGVAMQLSEKYEVKEYSIGSAINEIVANDSILYDDQLTNIHDAIQYISDVYEGDNLGAIILATDGIYNDGRNPVYYNSKQVIPVYGIALGDTTQRRDLQIKAILHNSIAYLDDEMLTQVDIQAYNVTAQTTRLTIEQEINGTYKRVHEENIAISGEEFFKSVPVKLAFNQSGVAHFRYRVTAITGEDNIVNNTKDIFVDVLDARQRIAIVAATAHPDIAALKQILSLNKNYEISTFTRNPSVQELSNIDMVIFHNLPSAERDISAIVTNIESRGVPAMYVVGDQTDIAKFNKIQNVVNIKGSSGNTSEAQASMATNFSLFTTSDELKRMIERFPPIQAPFGEYSFTGNTSTLLEQKIGGIQTDYPLLVFSDQDGKKRTFLFGTGIWQWKLFDYLEYANFNMFSELLDKSIAYTSTKEDKRKFKISSFENIYLENQDVRFTAELYNNSYELINDSEVTIKIRDANGNEFDYAFNRLNNYYELNAGKLSPGTYSYSGSATYGVESFEDKGRFTIREIQYELSDLTARHDILYSLAEKTNGGVIYPTQIPTLADQLFANNNLKPVIYASTETKSLLDYKWLFGLLALLLGAEWFLRRYWGSL